MKCLYLGRFQPFHYGHLKVIQKIKKDYEQIIIGIGSSQYNNKVDNPFTAEERISMIQGSLNEVGIENFKIILIPDIHDPPKWVSHVITINSDFEIVLTNNIITKKLFEEKGYMVKNTPLFQRKKFSGKIIRNKIKNNESWKELVPNSTYDIIIKIDGISRIKKMLS